MQVSLNWLKEYVDIDLDPQGLADLLTMSGSEVESVVKAGNECDGMVVCHITSVDPHPKCHLSHRVWCNQHQTR